MSATVFTNTPDGDSPIWNIWAWGPLASHHVYPRAWPGLFSALFCYPLSISFGFLYSTGSRRHRTITATTAQCWLRVFITRISAGPYWHGLPSVRCTGRTPLPARRMREECLRESNTPWYARLYSYNMYQGNQLIPGNCHGINSPDYRLESGLFFKYCIPHMYCMFMQNQKSNNNEKIQCKNQGVEFLLVFHYILFVCVYRLEYLRQHGTIRRSSLTPHNTGYGLSPAYPIVRPVICSWVRHTIYKSILKVLQTLSDEESTISRGNLFIYHLCFEYL